MLSGSFKEVTNKRPDVVEILKRNIGSNEVKIRLFECKDTSIIYTDNGVQSHVSISNIKRKVKQSEIDYACKHILKTKKVNIFQGRNGVIHLYSMNNK